VSRVGERERATQDRVVRLFRDVMHYEYLGNWERRIGNSNIEAQLLRANLDRRSIDPVLANRAIDELERVAALGGGRDLYEANKETYRMLRYGAKVRTGVGEHRETVRLIDWDNPSNNDFAIAEEVTLAGVHDKRPDIVIYINGIAVGVLELKRSIINVSEGIRQTIGNQRSDFIRPFFATNQLLFAGSDTQGLHYAVIDTPEKYWLQWKMIKDVPPRLREQLHTEIDGVEEPLDQGLIHMCGKDRLLELIHNFIVFDTGTKKTCRPNQYVGVKAAQERVPGREGGIIWHTQGAGKSLTMVWLAKWLRESQPDDPRVLIITDRTDLDDQIEQVFNGVDEEIYRTASGADLLATLNASEEWLICSLIHKFRTTDEEGDRDNAVSNFIDELHAKLPRDFAAKGNFFVLVDEAHRTQTGRMHAAMQELLPDAMFIGLTGTPLLKRDKSSKTSIETFGSYIHTYKYDEAARDGVVLDLLYEARNIDQTLDSPEEVDEWFDIETHGMSDLNKAELKKRWGTMQKIVTSEPRARRIVNDILKDMRTRPRLMDGRGNALLVGASINQACKFYDLFTANGFQGKCAIITSYTPSASDISKEDAGAGKTELIRQYETYRRMLASHFNEPEEIAVSKVEQFEEQVKRQFIKNPGQMRLIIVVDKLLTGFDAPSATYLYIDKKMRDHGLFQAICRVNRLDGDDKDYGYVVDYQDLFNSLEGAVNDYTGEDGPLGYEPGDIEGLLASRVDRCRHDLDDAMETLRILCEPVQPPRGKVQFQHYFCAVHPGDAEQLKDNEDRRVELYKAVSKAVRAYGNIATEMTEAGYSEVEASDIKQELVFYTNLRAEVKLGAGEDIDFKQYEAGMRRILDMYVSASATKVISDFGDKGLVELIVDLGRGAIDQLPDDLKADPEAVAETITNNIRTTIVDKNSVNPRYYEKMSSLLDDLIERRRNDAIAYEAFLAELLKLATQVGTEQSDTIYAGWVSTGAQRALCDFFAPDFQLAQKVDATIMSSKPSDWVGHVMKERLVRRAIERELPSDYGSIDDLFELVKARHEYR
jgi:type I restriction enzyme R subunit